MIQISYAICMSRDLREYRHVTITCLLCYSSIKHGSPPRATPPRSRMTRTTPPLPDLTTHAVIDEYAFVIGNLNKHKTQTTSRSRHETQLCQFTQSILAKYANINARPTSDIPRSRRTRAHPLLPFTHPFHSNFVCINA
jgi:hypothetical protein